ncbi:rho guanine nucleotide exchange factor 2 isoform 2-T9 [Glossina fuscipes fuscipes]
MEDPSITKRLIDFGVNKHKYEEVQGLSEESTNNRSSLPVGITCNSDHKSKDSNIASIELSPSKAATKATTKLDNQSPEIPYSEQRSSAKANTNTNGNNNSGINLKGGKKKSPKSSKIPRSPSLTSCLSGGNTYNNFQPPPISGIPPRTPPLPLSYQNRIKSMNGHGIAAISTNNNNNDNVVGNSTGNVTSGGGGTINITPANGQAYRNSTNMVPSARRPQVQIPSIAGESAKNFQYLTLTVRKDENGYGMKVSGDNPVFVESVKPGGAAHIAGLVAGDMILKVNGTEVRSEKHPTVVSYIKASTVVELAVKRSQKLARPTSVGVVPSTPVLSGRDRTASITGPQPVDSIKRREMETYKIQTLQKMLEQEKLNLERLKGDTNNPSYKLSEANIRKLREQLRQVGAEDAPQSVKYQSTINNLKAQHHHLSVSSNTTTTTSPLVTNTQFNHAHLNLHHHQNHHHHHHHGQAVTPQPQPPQSSPAFLSLLPRSLSSLSLGGRKSKIDKDLIAPLNNTTDFLQTSVASAMLATGSPIAVTSSHAPPSYSMSQSLHTPLQTHLQRNSAQQLFHLHQQQLLQQQQQQNRSTPKTSGKTKSKFTSKAKSLIEEDIPPPLPQRNASRPLQLDVVNNTVPSIPSATVSPISDLDHMTGTCSPLRNSPQPVSKSNSPQNVSGSSSNKGKRSKVKTKALSDPKMSTQIFLQMEGGAASGLCNNDQMGGPLEDDCTPPPLPPRQPGMLDEMQKGSFQNLNSSSVGRPSPNSVDTLMQYPLVATCTPVQRDSMAAAFPLSQRPNIVQQLQQHQQQQQQQQQQLQNSGAGGCRDPAVLSQTSHNLNHMNKHRRVVSSPDNIHTRHSERQIKTNSGSWELIEKDDESTPPGTPPPPYRHAHSASMSGNEESIHEHVGAGIFVESHNFALTTGATPPPPPPHSNRIQSAQSRSTQKEIISMEDEDTSDHEGPFIDENGPFNSLQRLLEADNVAFLAVFLNYVLSNSEPAPLLFYLITGLYKEGTAKDMRKWVYEIHSTFLVPRAPLAWYRQDESLAREVDAVLQNEADKVEILRKVFWKSRKRARDIICEQLREFQQKRTAGLGTIYGPTDAQLLEAKGDKQKEQHIFEDTLMKKLQILVEEYEKDITLEEPKKLALCSALSTVIHRIFITRSHPNSIIDRVHHFMIVRGHPLVLRQYYEVTNCNHCQTIIWGVSPQGFHCTDCKLNIHRPCSKVLDESCPGPVPPVKRKEKDLHNDNKISKLMGKIRPRTSTDLSGDKRRPDPDDLDPADSPNERLHSTSIQRQPSDRRPDGVNLSIRSNSNTSGHLNASDLQSSFHGADASMGATAVAGIGGGVSNALSCSIGPDGMAIPSITSNLSMGSTSGTTSGGISPAGVIGALNDLNAQDAVESNNARRERLHQQHQQNKSAPVSVNRSESYKERLSHKRNRSQRKTSDPSLTSRQNDDQADLGLSNSNFTASSNSSLSSGEGSESPSNSMEQMGGAGATAIAANISAHHHQSQPSCQESFHGSTSGGLVNLSFWGNTSALAGLPQRQWHFDSDEDDDLNEADWSSNVAAETLGTLTDGEKKRQEIINEIYQTERSHVRTLKLLERLFFHPLLESGLLSQEHLLLLFPSSLVSLRDLHGTFEQKLKQRRLDHNYVVKNAGDLLAGMFDGKSGEELREYAAQFCARQQIALEALKEKRRKDEQLQKLLSKAEAHKACRRLQLKDLLPTVLQRLTKYPLLFENLYKVTLRVVPEDTSEAEAIQKALESSRKILVDVNQAVKTAEDAHKLQNIQRKLDKSTFDKDEFKNLDLTQYRLIHDGSLTMKKNPSIQLHGLLFENMIVLLTKQDDKYSLKYLNATRNMEVNNKPVSPIMSIDSETLVRQEAADKNSFFLIKTKTSQMLELRAPSSSECKTWFKHISDAAEQYKPRTKNANHEPIDDPAIATLPHSNTRESLEITPERPPPQSATATVITTPLAPMIPMSPNAGGYDKTHTAQAVESNCSGNNNNGVEVQLRNGRRENGQTLPAVESCPPYYNIKQRLSQNELAQNAGAVNRTMSTRSCGEANNNYNSMNEFAAANGVTLRHTQSARQANNATLAPDDATNAANLNDGNKRDSTSIVYSNNSNNTRTLMQSSPPLVEPTAIQISISPAHTAEPVLTLVEKLRRLDASIREGLMEKQKIICDMFRLPIEHFHEIVDIAAMPEAPKDSADIALAAYAQVQSLTEVINEYMQITPEQEISAVSTTVCDKCHEKQQHLSREKNNFVKSDSPPPLPPPKKQTAQAQQQVPTPTVPKLQMLGLGDSDIHEDDDGYCEIDELRLPALPHLMKTISPPLSTAKMTVTPSFPPSLSKSTNQLQSPAVVAESQASNTTVVMQNNSTPELMKRQSTLSSDSIPEESPDEVTNALNDQHAGEMHKLNESKDVTLTENVEQQDQDTTNATANNHSTVNSKQFETKNTEEHETLIREDFESSETATNDIGEKSEAEAEDKEVAANEEDEKKESEDDSEDKDDDSTMHTAECESESLEIKESATGNESTEHLKHSITTATSVATEPKKQASNSTQADDSSLGSENAEMNEVYETYSSLKKHENAVLLMVDNSTQTLSPSSQHLSTTISPTTTAATNTQGKSTSTVATNTNIITNTIAASLCGPNRLQHAHTLEPSVPCHALNNIVSALNAQISLLLPKINERDMERDRLRKENLHLRELLNAMHERQRVEPKLETPSESMTSNACKTDDQIDGSSSAPSVTCKAMPTIALTVPTDTQQLVAAPATEGSEGGAEVSKTEVETVKLTATSTTTKPQEAKN